MAEGINCERILIYAQNIPSCSEIYNWHVGPGDSEVNWVNVPVESGNLSTLYSKCQGPKIKVRLLEVDFVFVDSGLP